MGGEESKWRREDRGEEGEAREKGTLRGTNELKDFAVSRIKKITAAT